MLHTQPMQLVIASATAAIHLLLNIQIQLKGIKRNNVTSNEEIPLQQVLKEKKCFTLAPATTTTVALSGGSCTVVAVVS